MQTISLITSGLFAFSATASTRESNTEFDWTDLKKSTSCHPNTVSNPTFTLNNVLNGAKWIHF